MRRLLQGVPQEAIDACFVDIVGLLCQDVETRRVAEGGSVLLGGYDGDSA